MRSGLKRAAVGSWMWIVLAIVSTGCSGCAGKAPAGSEPKVPDTTGIIRMIGRFAIASGCPIDARTIVTNGHVTDYQPFEPTPAFPLQFEQGERLGVAVPTKINRWRDIAIMKVMDGQDDLAMWYELAEAAPRPGDTIYLQAYDWGSKDKAFAPRLIASRVIRIVAGHIIFEPSGTPGSSGSCVLNADGHVVGINAFGKTVGSMGMQEVGGAVLFIKSLESLEGDATQEVQE